MSIECFLLHCRKKITMGHFFMHAGSGAFCIACAQKENYSGPLALNLYHINKPLLSHFKNKRQYGFFSFYYHDYQYPDILYSQRFFSLVCGLFPIFESYLF